MRVSFQWRTTASQSSDSNHRTPLTGSQNLLPTSALYRDWHTHPALLRRQHRQQRATVHLSHQQLRHTDKTHKNNWETPTEANFLFAQFLPQKHSHTALLHDLMFWSQEINARWSRSCHSKMYWYDYEKLKGQQQQYYMRDDNDHLELKNRSLRVWAVSVREQKPQINFLLFL